MPYVVGQFMKQRRLANGFAYIAQREQVSDEMRLKVLLRQVDKGRVFVIPHIGNVEFLDFSFVQRYICRCPKQYLLLRQTNRGGKPDQP